MKIRLADYKPGVLTEVRADYDPKPLDLEFVDLKYTKPLHLEGEIEKGIDTLVFRGALTGKIARVCGRCLRAAEDAFHRPFEFYYEIKGKEYVETLEDLREILILDHPISFICRPGCKGLCPHCGMKLNEKPCRCSVLPENNPFGKIRLTRGKP